MTQSLWFWCVFPSVAMSLGWMLRGYIGGGFLGAMIPGSMVALALCLLLKRETEAGLAAGMAAVGVGFGGQETYGQTVGLALVPATYWWGILGFFLKGGIWGLLGGAIIGISFSKAQFARRDLIASFGLMVAGTYAGWKLFNEPKLVYFSNPVDKPRAELWFGLLLGAVLLLGFLMLRSEARLPLRFALWGFLGGSFGFALGAAAQVWGRDNAPDFPFGWWKFMEMTFGALLGLAYGYCAWRNRAEIAAQPARAPQNGIGQALGWAALSILITLVVEPQLHSRLESTIAGAVLLAVMLSSEQFSWQTGITTTYCAFAIDLLRYRPTYPPTVMWTLVVLTTLAVALIVARRGRALDMFVLMTWTSTGMGLLKSFLPPAGAHKTIVMEIVFVIFAIAITLWARQAAGTGPAAGMAEQQRKPAYA